MPLTPDELLRDLEALPYSARMGRMAELGRAAASDAAAAAIIAALEQGGFFERILAVQSCYGSRDGGHVLRAIGDPSRGVRALARALVPLCCDDRQAQDALERLPSAERRSLLRSLLARRRLAAIDTYIESRAAAQDRRLPPILPFASAIIARRHLAQALRLATNAFWAHLARRQPALAVESMREQLVGEDEVDDRVLGHINAALGVLGERAPDQGIELTRLAAGRLPLARLNLEPLLQRRPAEVSRLLIAIGPEDAPPRLRYSTDACERALPQLDDAAIIALLDLGLLPTEYGAAAWLRRLPPARRATIYHAAEQRLRKRLNVELVAVLPADLREHEARRCLSLPRLAAAPAERLRFAAFLPWQELRDLIEAYLGDPDRALRGVALQAIVYAVRFARGRAAEAIALIHARRHEQDPVRQDMLTALADLPPSIWQADHLEGLGQIAREALDARDLSAATAAAAERLISRLIPFHPDWAAHWLAVLVGERGHTTSRSGWEQLRDVHAQRLAAALGPLLERWERRGHEDQIVDIAEGFGTRLRVLDALVERLDRIARTSRSSATAERALALLAAHERDRLAELIPALLATDSSAITLPTVQDYLHRRRQDLLTPYLARRAYQGRFDTGQSDFVPVFDHGFQYWPPRQQAAYAATLLSQATDAAGDTSNALASVRRLARLPAIAPDGLIRLATDAPTAIRDAALLALGRLDAGQGMPTLLAALGDERARAAIYGLGRAMKTLPPLEALRLLTGVALDRPTVAKEVVRLIGTIESEAAYAALLALDRHVLHRDVRVALLGAFLNHPERAETWPILERAAAAPDPALAIAAARLPPDQVPAAMHPRIMALLEILLRHPDPRVRLLVLQRPDPLPVADPERRLLPQLTAILSAPAREATRAASALVGLYAARDPSAIGQTAAALAADRRALVRLLDAVAAQGSVGGRNLAAAARAILDALAADPLTSTPRIRLAVRTLGGEELAALLRDMAERGELHAEALMAAVEGLSSTAGQWAVYRSARRWRRPGRGQALAALETPLRSSGDERLRRVALAALVAQTGDHRGWTEERLARLTDYRADPAPLVAGAAQFTLPEEELETVRP